MRNPNRGSPLNSSIEKEKYYKMFTINVIMIVIDEFQQLNLFLFELIFYVIGDMPVKSIVKFVISLASLLKKVPIILKMLYFYKILGLLLREMGPFFSRKIFYLLWGFRPRPKLPRPWAGTDWDLVAWIVSENQSATQKVNDHWINRISRDIEDRGDQYEDYVDH